MTRRHVDAQSLPGALTGGLNYYRALSKGLWTRPRKEIRQPVKIIWGEDDTAMGKELAEPPKNRVPNQEVVFIPKVGEGGLPLCLLFEGEADVRLSRDSLVTFFFCWSIDV